MGTIAVFAFSCQLQRAPAYRLTAWGSDSGISVLGTYLFEHLPMSNPAHQACCQKCVTVTHVPSTILLLHGARCWNIIGASFPWLYMYGAFSCGPLPP